jgi:hypothetical protein
MTLKVLAASRAKWDVVTPRLVANLTGIDEAQARGMIPLESADRSAVRLGLHPCSIWGDEWFEGAA